MTMITSLMRVFERRERGQMLIVFALVVVPVSLVIGVVAVDASMWQSERRGAQKDADLAALAGAIQLLDPSASAADAQVAATSNKTSNDQQGNASFVGQPTVEAGCFGSGNRLDSVTVNINHATRGFFSDAFRIPVPTPGAHAKACAGSVTGMTGIVPFQIDAETAPCFVTGAPQFGTLCGMEFGSNNDPNGNNPRGLLDLQASGGHCSDARGSGDPYPLITNGAPGHCIINTNTPPSCNPTKNGPWDDCVAVQGGDTKKVLDAVHARIAREGACDALPGANHDRIDDFDEVVRLVYGDPSPTGDRSKRVYEPIDCDPNTPGVQVSPRLITIIVLSGPPTAGNDGNPIMGFAGFYLAGCSSTAGLTSDAQLTLDEKKCNVQGVQAAPIVSSGASFVSLNLAQCGKGQDPTPCPTPTNTPPPTSTRTPTPVSPTATPTLVPTNTEEPCRTGPGNPHVPLCTPTPPLGNTETPTSTPGGPPPTATPTQPAANNNNGHAIVYGDFVNLIVTNGDIGDFDPTTTLTGVTLVQ